MKRIVFYYVITLSIIACSPEKKQEIFQITATPIELKGSICSSTENIRPSLEMVSVGSNLIMCQYDGDNALDIYNTSTNYSYGWGKRGNGPGEFSVVRCWGTDTETQTSYLYDENYRKLRCYKYALAPTGNITMSQEEEISNPNTDGMSVIRNATRLASGNFVGYSNAGYNRPIVVMNEKMEVIGNIGNIPDHEHESQLRLSEYGAYLSSYHNYFVFAHGSIGYVALYKQVKNGGCELIWEHYLEMPIYEEKSLAINKLKIGFNSIVMTANNIYCLYTGEKYPSRTEAYPFAQKVLVFDYSGKLKHYYHLDYSIKHFTISTDEKCIYGLSVYPDTFIVKFSVY